MATSLDNRAELRLAVYRLAQLGSSDGALTEHQTATNDVIHQAIFQAMRDAQSWYLSSVNPDYWQKTSSTLSWSGTEAANAGRYSALPTDFLRLYGDKENPALRRPSGRRWGTLIDPPDRTIRGAFYWIWNDRLWIARGASPYSDLVMDYTYDIPELTDDTTAPDFPEEDRILIPAYAAVDLADHGFFPGSMEMKAGLNAYLLRKKREVYVRGRRTKEPRRMKSSKVVGSRWFATG